MSIDINTCYIYMKSIKIIKTKQKYMKQWRSNLARLNMKIKDHMLDNYNMIDYEVRKPSLRSNITWRPYMVTISGEDLLQLAEDVSSTYKECIKLQK